MPHVLAVRDSCGMVVMAAVAALFNIPESDESLLEWAFNHMGHHRDINRVILQRFGVVLPEFPLDPMNPLNLGVWRFQHQLMHTNQNAVLGIPGTNLLDVNWLDQSERAEWIQLNGSEHVQANDILGV